MYKFKLVLICRNSIEERLYKKPIYKISFSFGLKHFYASVKQGPPSSKLPLGNM